MYQGLSSTNHLRNKGISLVSDEVQERNVRTCPNVAVMTPRYDQERTKMKVNCQCCNTSTRRRQVTPNPPVTAESTRTWNLYARFTREDVQWMGCEGKRTSWIVRATTVRLIYTWTRTT